MVDPPQGPHQFHTLFVFNRLTNPILRSCSFSIQVLSALMASHRYPTFTTLSETPPPPFPPSPGPLPDTSSSSRRGNPVGRSTSAIPSSLIPSRNIISARRLFPCATISTSPPSRNNGSIDR